MGVDIDPESAEHARLKYNLQTRVGSAESIPAEANEFDVIVFFETIEHVADPDRFLDESIRVCKPGGGIIISTPSKGNYLQDAVPNEFHVSEMTSKEFADCLMSRFRSFALYGQILSWAPWWSKRMLSVAGKPSLLKISGTYRICSIARQIFALNLCSNRTHGFCEEPIKRIITSDSLISDTFNPYLV